MNIRFNEHVMFCNSTGVQTVNLLPALQFGVQKTVIVSTPHTEKQGLTSRLVYLLEKKGISCEIITLSENDEKNFRNLSSKLIEKAQKYQKIIWNFSGGQKIPSIAIFYAFHKRVESNFKDDYAIYIEAQPPETWILDSNFDRFWKRTSCPISLHEILYLFNYETMKDENKIYPDPSIEVREKIEIGRKALRSFKESEVFREAFFNFMKSSKPSLGTKEELKEAIKKALNEVKPEVKDLHITKSGYEEFERRIKTIFSNLDRAKNIGDLDTYLAPLKLLLKPHEIFEDYWNSIKRATIERVLQRIEFEEIKLINKELTETEKNKLRNQIKEIGGDISLSERELYKKDVKSFSVFKSNGILFEWMVVASIIDEIQKNPLLKEYISEIYHSVKTRRLDFSERPDAEHDIIIVTKFGTMILIELKTYEFSGDLAQAQEALVYKKSGPYGQAIIIGPLLSDMVKINHKGIKEFPAYINGPIRSQEETARQNNIRYYYLDQIPVMLQEKLFVQTE